MIFVYHKWEEFCKKLYEKGIVSIPARNVTNEMESFLVLKHDVENNPIKAYKFAKIENNYGHKGSYYIQAYLLKKKRNVIILKKIQEMGHEVSYHYDVMDSNGGKIASAIDEFSVNIKLFESNGFNIKTVCQHGNPIVERIGYHSNRDFFRNKYVRELYSEIADIMVNFKTKYGIEYSYYSDAGRKIKRIYDPINNDIENSDEKNTIYEDLDILLGNIDGKSIVSVHPHRWSNSIVMYLIREKAFFLIRGIAKKIVNVSFVKKLASKYYFLAKYI